MDMDKALFYVGIVLFGVLLHQGKQGLALLLLLAAFVNGIWRIYRYIQDAREREARQWGRMDLHMGPRDDRQN